MLHPGAGEPGDLHPVPAEELGAQEETGHQGHQEVRQALAVFVYKCVSVVMY